MTESKSLSFKISTGLKNLIGRDLISDKYIAVFELVKNSYDAGASRVTIEFAQTEGEHSRIIISDNGCGMNYDDIINKWLFVAYSEKKPQHRKGTTYREEIKREVAGAKGVGRFSCDRLGEQLTLITKTSEDDLANKVIVDWNQFEIDDNQEFMNIPVDYSVVEALPTKYRRGTTLIVDKLREEWTRDELLRLKRSLMKLISPDANKGELPFEVELIVPSELETDRAVLGRRGINPDRDVVNGIIRNDVFEKLNIKTTSISVEVSKDGSLITTTLSDRGEYVFCVKEKNRKYAELRDISIVIFYLNQKAKTNFTRQMGGVTPKSYGSVFIYKNGFRINPYGEPGRDFFGIDQRKAQGWKRFLGTREIMGRISIKGENEQFIETTSRAHGFIETPAVIELENLFIEKVLKVLEKYVVSMINWGEPLRTDPQHTISPSEISDKIISQFISGVDQNDIVSIDFNPSILESATHLESTDNLENSLKKLESVAEKTQDEGLYKLTQSLKRKTESIISQNAQLEDDNAKKEHALAIATEQSKIREQQIFFLKGTVNQEVTNLLNGFHSIYALTDATKGNLSFLRDLLETIGEFEKKDLVMTIIGQLYQSNEKAHKLSDLAIHGNQMLKQHGRNSLYDYLKQYIDAGLAISGIKYDLAPRSSPFDCRFDSSSVGVIFDNIASNSIKAGATVLSISLEETSKYVEASFEDNGIGLPADTDVSTLFDWGVSSNRAKKGFGIGLYHIKQLVEEMHGTVRIDTAFHDGFRIIIGIRK